MVRVGLVQMVCQKSAISQNMEVISHYLAEAAARQIDIIAFPEMCLTGYADPTKSSESVLRLDDPQVLKLLRLTEGFDGSVLVGIIEANPYGKPFITQIVARSGVLIGSYRKVTIKDDETKWFSPGKSVPVFQHGTVTFGIAICADLVNREVFAQSNKQGAQLVFELAAPGLYGEQETRNWETGYAWWSGECEKYLSRYAKDYGNWVLVATQAGRTVDEDFPGGGFVFAPTGERVSATSDGSPGAVFLEIDFESNSVTVLP